MIQKRPNRSFSRSVVNFFGRSAIVRAMCRLTSAIYKKCIYGFFGTLLTLYDGFAEKMKKSAIFSLFSRKNRDYSRPTVGYKISRAYETSLFSRFADAVKWGLLGCQLNTLGILFFSFGFYSVVIILLKRYSFSYEEISFPSLLTSVIFIVVSIILLFSRRTLISVINESRILNFILFDFLELRKVSSKDCDQTSHFGAGFAVLLGILLGALSLFTQPYMIALGLGVIVAGVIVLHSPETGVIATFLVLPFTPTMVLAGIVIITAFSLFLKVVRRKRLIKVTPIDLTVAAFALFIVSGGVISLDVSSSLPKMLVFVCFISMYFIVKNIIRSEQLARGCVNSLTAGAVLVSVIGLFQYFFGSVSTIWQDTEMFSDIKGRAVSTFQNPNVLGEYLVLVIPVIFAMFAISKSARSKFRYFVSFMLCSACLIFTWSRGAWLGFIAAVFIFIVMSSHKTFACFLLSVPALCLAASFFIDTSVINRLASIGNTADSSTLYRFNIWKGTISMLSDTWLYGIGIGTEVFSSVYPQYSLSGTEVAPHSHSLYLQIISEMGVFALVIFLIFCITFIGMMFSSLKNTSGKRGKTILVGFLCGVCAFLVQGATDYVWYNYRIFLLFWAMVGLAAAVVNNCKDADSRKQLYI